MPASTAGSTGAVAVLLGLVLAGCGQQVSFGPPQSSVPVVSAPGAPDASPTGTVLPVAPAGGVPAEDADTDTDGGGVPDGGGDAAQAADAAPGVATIGAGQDQLVITVAQVAARDATERSVAGSFLRYWRLRMAAEHDNRVDTAALAQVAAGDGSADVMDSVSSDGTHKVGTLTTNVIGVRASGAFARLRACSVIHLREVDAGGAVVDQKDRNARQDAALRRFGTQWKVVSYNSDSDGC